MIGDAVSRMILAAGEPAVVAYRALPSDPGSLPGWQRRSFAF
jgi:hypothetical protein